jgi:hypothetical protein
MPNSIGLGLNKVASELATSSIIVANKAQQYHTGWVYQC